MVDINTCGCARPDQHCEVPVPEARFMGYSCRVGKFCCRLRRPGSKAPPKVNSFSGLTSFLQQLRGKSTSGKNIPKSNGIRVPSSTSGQKFLHQSQPSQNPSRHINKPNKQFDNIPKNIPASHNRFHAVKNNRRIPHSGTKNPSIYNHSPNSHRKDPNNNNLTPKQTQQTHLLPDSIPKFPKSNGSLLIKMPLPRPKVSNNDTGSYQQNTASNNTHISVPRRDFNNLSPSHLTLNTIVNLPKNDSSNQNQSQILPPVVDTKWKQKQIKDMNIHSLHISHAGIVDEENIEKAKTPLGYEHDQEELDSNLQIIAVNPPFPPPREMQTPKPKRHHLPCALTFCVHNDVKSEKKIDDPQSSISNKPKSDRLRNHRKQARPVYDPNIHDKNHPPYRTIPQKELVPQDLGFPEGIKAFIKPVSQFSKRILPTGYIDTKVLQVKSNNKDICECTHANNCPPERRDYITFRQSCPYGQVQCCRGQNDPPPHINGRGNTRIKPIEFPSILNKPYQMSKTNSLPLKLSAIRPVDIPVALVPQPKPKVQNNQQPMNNWREDYQIIDQTFRKYEVKTKISNNSPDMNVLNPEHNITEIVNKETPISVTPYTIVSSSKSIRKIVWEALPAESSSTDMPLQIDSTTTTQSYKPTETFTSHPQIDRRNATPSKDISTEKVFAVNGVTVNLNKSRTIDKVMENNLTNNVEEPDIFLIKNTTNPNKENNKSQPLPTNKQTEKPPGQTLRIPSGLQDIPSQLEVPKQKESQHSYEKSPVSNSKVLEQLQRIPYYPGKISTEVNKNPNIYQKKSDQPQPIPTQLELSVIPSRSVNQGFLPMSQTNSFEFQGTHIHQGNGSSQRPIYYQSQEPRNSLPSPNTYPVQPTLNQPQLQVVSGGSVDGGFLPTSQSHSIHSQGSHQWNGSPKRQNYYQSQQTGNSRPPTNSFPVQPINHGTQRKSSGWVSIPSKNTAWLEPVDRTDIVSPASREMGFFEGLGDSVINAVTGALGWPSW